ncbi:hypothetical protein K488DRAFT_89900 [Vararia minispora EC-137]|uniref:Uncharacterized protein n=1 Tax=Vararia minispora EC-137 TaxID=1314806 RepID=A0ACB8Q9I6_9AGAM|nr:hypothetical protein K488DRAFT_89900 [Vararia minispora EC-137]
MEAWIEEGDRVQWHRAEASMQRWQEQFERLQADFLRTVETFHKLDVIWSAVAQESEGKPGHAAYAMRKAGMWRKMAEDCARRFEDEGFKVGEGETLGERIANHYDVTALVARIGEWRKEENDARLTLDVSERTPV